MPSYVTRGVPRWRGNNSGMSHGATMALPDAQLFLMSAAVPNDQFLLYVFDGVPDIGRAVDELGRNAARCDDLRLRVMDEVHWRYPQWVSGGVTAEQFVVRESPDLLEAVAGVVHEQLDVTRMAWRVHVFPMAMRCAVVVQIAHALGDGTRSSALAAALLGRGSPIPVVAKPDRGLLPWRALLAARAHRRLVRDTEAGLVPPPNPPRPALSINAEPRGKSVVRLVTVDRERLSGPTVTVAALVAISEALGGHLVARGDDVGRLGAEIPMAHGLGGELTARNNFHTVNVDLHPGLDRATRSARIAAELTGHRRRMQHPAFGASLAATAAVPAPLLRWGVRQFDPSARSGTVSGHTVVSSVNRGSADLSFGGRPVLFTGGFPALSPMMSLTHGVHGIGETVTVSVHADPVNVDVDEYLDRLESALRHPC